MAERIQNNECSDLHLAIVVPTIVLMHQWYDEFQKHSNLPMNIIGMLGGGYRDSFTEGKRVLISVLAGAKDYLNKNVRDSKIGDKLMLVVDECHRAAAGEVSKVFKTPRRYNLGLSATPETAWAENYSETAPGKELGDIFYELSFEEALHLEIIPPFTIYHYGFLLSPQERQKYDELSRQISNAEQELKARAPEKMQSGNAFFSWIQSGINAGSDYSSLAQAFLNKTSLRDELLYNMSARREATLDIIKNELKTKPDAKIIIFHERIDSINELYLFLIKNKISTVIDHSELPNSYRQESLSMFHKDYAQVLVSAKALIEGFNCPATDVGIIVASTESVRQRIQSIGRILRKHGNEKSSRIYVLYAKDTKNEMIYKKNDWNDLIGLDCNRNFIWQKNTALTPIPMIKPLPDDTQIDPESLIEGIEYPGQYEGEEYSCDTSLNIKNSSGLYALNMDDIAKKIINIKRQAGKFKVTYTCNYVLARIPRGDNWETVFITRLEDSIKFQSNPLHGSSQNYDLSSWANSNEPGTILPVQDVVVQESLKYSQRRGGIIIKPVMGGQKFARFSNRANNKNMGLDAENLVAAIKGLISKGIFVNRFAITSDNIAIFRTKGVLKLLYKLSEGLEFPD